MKKLVQGMILAAILISCETEDPFSSYRGVNLIKDRGFSVAGSGGWQVHMSDVQTFDYSGYLNFAGANSVDGKAAYRLEIVNLFPDGMMEDGSAAANWSAPAPSVSGGRLDYTLTADQWTDFNLKHQTLGLLNAADFDKNLDISLRFTAETQNIYVYNSVKNGEEFAPNRINVGETPRTLEMSVQDGDAILFRLGTSKQTFSSAQDNNAIDNVQAVLRNGSYQLRLQLPYQDEGRPSLEPGTYRFSFKVRNDPSTGSANRFFAGSVSFGFGRLTGTFRDSQTRTGSWTSWTEISHDFVESSFPQTDIPTSGETLTLELWISPGSPFTSEIRPGSLLIAEPSLIFLPDGE